MWKNLPLKGYIYASFALSAVSIIAILGLLNYLPPIVPFLYGLPAGSDQLISSLGLLIAPSINILIIVLNIVLASFSKDLFFKRTLIVSGLFVSILTTITVLKIIFLVGFF